MIYEGCRANDVRPVKPRTGARPVSIVTNDQNHRAREVDMTTSNDVAECSGALHCSTDDLLKRLEQKAVQVSRLEQQVATLQSRLDELPERIEKQVVSQMANAAVNCGASSSCAVARWRMEAIEKRDSP